MDPDRCSEEPVDVNVILRSAKNTNDSYRTIREQSGANGKDWDFFFIERTGSGSINWMLFTAPTFGELLRLGHRIFGN